LGASTRRLALALGFLAGSPLLLGSVWLNFYDAWPAALTVAALVAPRGGGVAAAFVCLGLAAAAKVYAVVLIVPAGVFVSARLGRRALGRGVAAFLVTIAAVVGPFLIVAPH